MFAQTQAVVDLSTEGALLDYLAKSFDKFNAIAVQNPADRLKDLRLIHLRGPKRKEPPKGYAYDASYIECEDKPLMEQFPEVIALVSFIRGTLGCQQVGNVMMSVIGEGAFILPHTDPGAYFEHYRRLHIPIFTDPQCVAYAMSYPLASKPKQLVEMHFSVGNVWELNNCDIHWFQHRGTKPRFHVVVDMV